ncbi:MAG TPA: Ig-like domain-containing protein [Candidatus Limnocylindrales bacterium]|nr:Ig-like domain-containing protein [Candidatus Limnocylindrales bacterium]
MRTNHSHLSELGRFRALLMLLSSITVGVQAVKAQPTIVSTVPGFLATGVSPSAAVVFTFSEPMDTTATAATFYDGTTFTELATTPSWNAQNTVLTCTPVPPFPANKQIIWSVDGQNPTGDALGGNTGGLFTTGSGGASTGSGTNRITSFTIGKVYSYDQSSSGPPIPSAQVPFIFIGSTTLASNRTANQITLTLPNAAVSNLNQTLRPESYLLSYFSTSSNTLETTFPQGVYTFTVNATASNQSVTVTLPANMTQPNAPHVTNIVAAQAVDPSKPFKLSWDPFVGGGGSDYIQVMVGDWTSGDYGTPGALDGTATSVTIPAGVLVANSNYTASVGFDRAVWSTNSTYATGAYRATLTTFNLKTLAGTSAPTPVVSNPGWTGNSFGFDVDTVPGQVLTAVYSTDCSLPISQWQILLTTNSPGTRVHFSDPSAAGKTAAFYKVRNGP